MRVAVAAARQGQALPSGWTPAGRAQERPGRRGRASLGQSPEGRSAEQWQDWGGQERVSQGCGQGERKR